MDRQILAYDWSLEHLQQQTPGRYAETPAAELLATAERNDSDAQFTIGYRCETGDQGTPVNLEVAVQWYQRAASRASVDAALNLGRLMLNGPDELRHALNAAKLFHYAAERGNVDACFVMGVLFDAGVGLPQKPEEAVHFYRRAAKAGHRTAAINLSRILFSASDSKLVHLEAFKLLKEFESESCPLVWTNLGVAYEFGLSVPIDSAKAADLFLQAAECDVPEAMFHLGRLHHLGRGVAHDEGLAAEWWNKAAELGCEAAVQKLGELLIEDEPIIQPLATSAPNVEPGSATNLAQTPPPVSVPPEPALAEPARPTANLRRIKYRGGRAANTIAELMTIAEAGIVDAQFNLGVLFRDGSDGRQSPHDAIYWLRQAGNQGDAEALWLLGSMYADADGIAKCEWEAEKLFRRAIELLTEQGQDSSHIVNRLEAMLGPVLPQPKRSRPDPVPLVEAALAALRESPPQAEVAHERLRQALQLLENR